jgi:protein-tyrosine phosphatase
LIEEIIKKKVTPIIANPEYNIDIRNNFSIIEKLIKKGCLMQMNADSLLRKNLKGFVTMALKKEAYHIVASNAHNAGQYMDFGIAYKKLTELVGKDKAFELTSKNPLKIINGEYGEHHKNI